MPIVVVNTDFVVHQEDEQWGPEEIAFLSNYQPSVQETKLSKATLAEIASRLKKGDESAWELMNGNSEF